jgi:hypothetical protein
MRTMTLLALALLATAACDPGPPMAFECVTARGDTLRALGHPTIRSQTSVRGHLAEGGTFALNNCARLTGRPTAVAQAAD